SLLREVRRDLHAQVLGGLMPKLLLLRVGVRARKAAVDFLHDALVERNLGGIDREGIDDDLGRPLIDNLSDLPGFADLRAGASRQQRKHDKQTRPRLDRFHGGLSNEKPPVGLDVLWYNRAARGRGGDASRCPGTGAGRAGAAGSGPRRGSHSPLARRYPMLLEEGLDVVAAEAHDAAEHVAGQVA